MATEGRLRRDLSWPVPAEDLQDLDVIEIVHGEDGQVLWRVENRPAATPQDCHEVLMKHRHLDEPADLAGVPLNEVALEVPTPLASAASPDVAEPPFPADESSHIPELSELPVLQEFPQPPEVPELAAPGRRTGHAADARGAGIPGCGHVPAIAGERGARGRPGAATARDARGRRRGHRRTGCRNSRSRRGPGSESRPCLASSCQRSWNCPS